MQNLYKNVLVVAIILLSIIAGIYGYTLYFVLHTDPYPVSIICLTGVLITGITAWIVVLTVRSYPTTVAVVLHALFIATIFSVAAGITDYLAEQWIAGHYFQSYKTSEKSPMLRILVLWLFHTFLATYTALLKKNDALEKKFSLQSDASVLLREAELFKLRQQLQPHFLYNSLNSISALIISQPEKALEMIGKLSDFLRGSVKRESEEKMPLDEELAHIRSYLHIESIRFGNRLQVSVENFMTENATIPPFLLQPLLENAIKFGLYGMTGSVAITINIAIESNMLIFIITNPYDPDIQPPSGTGFGLGSIRRRLYLLFARNDLLETRANDHIFTIILKIPQHV